MSIYDRMTVITQREAEEDALYSIFLGHSPIQPHILRIHEHLSNIELGERYKKVLDKVRDTPAREPKIALILFAIWLCPELNLTKDTQPRRSEPFLEKIENMCLDILKGKMLSVQEFVDHTVTDYIMTPKC